MADITGTGAGETINGTNDDDNIVGLGGNDTINGNGGNDTIIGDGDGGSGNSNVLTVPNEGGVATLLVWDLSQLSFSGGNPFPDSTHGLSTHDLDGITMTIGEDQTPVGVGVDDHPL